MGVDEDHCQSGEDHPPRGTPSENKSCQKTCTDVQEKSPVRSSETSMTSDSSPSPVPENKSKMKSTTIAFSVERILGCDKLSDDSKSARSRHEDRAADFLPYHRPSDLVDFRPALGAFQSSSFHPVIPDLYNYVCPWTNVHRDRYGAVVRRVGHPYQNRTPPKRKKPRTAFTRHQVLELEKRFARQKYLASAERSSLAKTLSMTDAQVKTWFQNRRTKWRRETAEEREIERQAAQKFLLSLRGDEPRHQTMYHPLCVPAPSTPLPISPRETLDPGVK